MRVATLRYAEVGLPTSGWLPVFSGGKLGFTDLNGEEKLPPTYEKSEDILSYRFHNGMMKVKKNGMFGFIDKNLKEVVEFKYDDARPFQNGFAAVKKDGAWGFVSKDGKQKVPCVYRRVSDFTNGLAAVLGENGLLSIPLMFDNKDNPTFNEDGVCTTWKNGEKIHIDKTGNVVEDYEEPSLESDASHSTSTSLKTEWLKLTRKISYDIADAPYEEIYTRSNGNQIISKNDGWKKYGLAVDGKEVIPCKYDAIEGPFTKIGYYIVELSGRYGVCNGKGKEIAPCEYQHVGTEGDKYIMVVKDDKVGFIDTAGKIVIPCKLDDAKPFNADITAIERHKKDKSFWNLIDSDGKEFDKAEYEDAMVFENGLCPVKRKGKWGFIDESGKLIIAAKYEFSFSDENEKWSYSHSRKGDPIPVSKDGKMGYIGLDGKTVIPFQYDEAYAFDAETSYAKVRIGRKTFYVDKKGKETKLTAKQSPATKPQRPVSTEQKDGKFVLLKNGKVTMPFIDEVKPFEGNNKYTAIKIAHKWGAIDGDGKIVLPCIYDGVEWTNDASIAIVRVLNKKGLIDMTAPNLTTKSKTVKWIPLDDDIIFVEKDE